MKGSTARTVLEDTGFPHMPMQAMGIIHNAVAEPILMTTMSLTARSGNFLHVTGLDAIDNSQDIDIRPYVPQRHPATGTHMPQWMERIQTEIVAGDENDA